MLGLDLPGVLHFEIEGVRRVDARFETGHSTEERISAGQYVKFPFEPLQRAAFVEGRAAVWIAVDHSRYRARVALPDKIRRSLAEDLTT